MSRIGSKCVSQIIQLLFPLKLNVFAMFHNPQFLERIFCHFYSQLILVLLPITQKISFIQQLRNLGLLYIKMWKNPKLLHPNYMYLCSGGQWVGSGFSRQPISWRLRIVAVCVCVYAKCVRQRDRKLYQTTHVTLDHPCRRPKAKGLPHSISAPSSVLPDIRTHDQWVRCSNQRAS